MQPKKETEQRGHQAEARRQHDPLSGGTELQSAAMKCDARRVLERKRARDVGGRHLARTVTQHRRRLDPPRPPEPRERDLKRGFGGIVDVEFLVQLFQLKYGRDVPAARTPNTWNALEALRSTGLLSEGDYAVLRASYDFLRLVESRLRIVYNRSLDELPENHEDLEKLARRLGCEQFFRMTAADRFLADLERHTQQTRQVFNRLVSEERLLPRERLAALRARAPS